MLISRLLFQRNLYAVVLLFIATANLTEFVVGSRLVNQVGKLSPRIDSLPVVKVKILPKALPVESASVSVASPPDTLAPEAFHLSREMPPEIIASTLATIIILISAYVKSLTGEHKKYKNSMSSISPQPVFVDNFAEEKGQVINAYVREGNISTCYVSFYTK